MKVSGVSVRVSAPPVAAQRLVMSKNNFSNYSVFTHCGSGFQARFIRPGNHIFMTVLPQDTSLHLPDT
jgi:hypothetical protein